ncbi:MAG: hypothetical protein Q8Q41_00515 [bacterium]|nr:hypothetical protein [bacterium]
MKQFLSSLSSVNKLLVLLLAVALVALGYVLWQYQPQADRDNSYSAVLLSSGELYFGRLHSFPSLSLTDVYLLQRNTSDAQNPVSIAKFTNVYWGPSDRLWLNRADVVWTTRLDAQSQVIKAIRAIKASSASPSAVSSGPNGGAQAGAPSALEPATTIKK